MLIIYKHYYMKKILSKNDLSRVKIHYFFRLKPQNSAKTISFLITKIKKERGKYAGFATKSEIEKFLIAEIFGFNKSVRKKQAKINIRVINNLIKSTLIKCDQKIESKNPLNIYIFPSYNQFVKKRMFGVSGYTQDKNNILLFISPKKGWQSSLKNTVTHEYAHLVTYNYHKWKTLLDSLIFEGIAEHFRESVISGKPSPWTQVLSPQKSKIVFKKIYNKLQSANEKYYQQLFLEFDKKYPLWAGYTLGYQILQLFLRHQKNLPWSKIIKLKPKDILAKSQYQ